MALTSGTVVVELDFKDSIAAGPSAYDPSGNHPTWTAAFPVPVTQRPAVVYSNGTTAGKVDRACSMQFTSGVALSVDLLNAFSTDQLVGFGNVRTLMVVNADTSPAHVLRFGNDGTANLFVGALVGSDAYREVRPGTAYLDQHPLGAAGYVVDSSHRYLRFDPLGVSLTWTVIILGN